MPVSDEQVWKRVGWGCLAIIVLPIVAFVVLVFINDYQIRREVEKESQERAQLDARYSAELERLDGIFERFFQKVSAEEREHYSLARDYFHTGEEACRGDIEERRFKFNELETGIRQMTELLDVMDKNLGMPPEKAKELVKDFRLF
jgi:hypothetical protein